jgi:DNA polymerase
MSDTERKFLLASLRGYLCELRETGVYGLPFAVEAGGKGAGSPVREGIAETGEEQVSGGDASVQESVEHVRRELGECLRCALGAARTRLVFGTGNPRARVLFVGEAPGTEEDLTGEPFVGEAGQLLGKIIQAMGFSRGEVYICNVLKCRPPENRDPLPEEIEACRPFLLRQVKSVGPEVIVALGTFASQTLLRTREPISRLRGRFHDYHGIPLMPTFHPAYLLRNPAMKREVWDDMKAVMRMLGREPTEKERSEGKG